MHIELSKSVKIRNLTKNEIILYLSNGKLLNIPPSGIRAKRRLMRSEVGEKSSLVIYEASLGEVYFTDRSGKEIQLFNSPQFINIVTLEVFSARGNPDNFYILGEPVSIGSGKIVGSFGLTRGLEEK